MDQNPDTKTKGIRRKRVKIEGQNGHFSQSLILVLCNGQEALRQSHNPSDWRSRFSS